MAATESSGNGYALYNGAKLPNIDSVWTDEVKAQYPYAWMNYVYLAEEQVGGGTLWLCNYPVSVAFDAVDGIKVTAQSDGTYTKYDILNGTWREEYGIPVDEWEKWFNPTTSDVSNGTFWVNEPTWTSNTILNTDGSTYMEATDPIPLDGMNVIEWDGSTNGLLSVYDMFFKVSNTTLTEEELTDSYMLSSSGIGISGEGNVTVVGDGLLYLGNCAVISVLNTETTIYDIAFPETGLYFTHNGTEYVSKFAYTPTDTPSEPEEPEQPKWQFNLRDFLSGVAAGAASRGVLPRQKKEPIAYLYNGVQLPALPEVEGQYMVIDYDSGEYLLIPCAHPLIRKADGNIYQAEIATYYVYKVINGEWSTYSGNHYKIEQVVFGTAIWANTDILNEDGSVYLAASEPVPIYE